MAKYPNSHFSEWKPELSRQQQHREQACTHGIQLWSSQHTRSHFKINHTLLTGSPKLKADSKTSKFIVINKHIHASWYQIRKWRLWKQDQVISLYFLFVCFCYSINYINSISSQVVVGGTKLQDVHYGLKICLSSAQPLLTMKVLLNKVNRTWQGASTN